METKRELFQTMVKRFGLLNRNCCEVGSLDITMVQSQILYEISKRSNAPMQEVADALGTDISTFSRQIQNMIKLDLIKKSPSEADKRIYLLSLTEQGNKVAQEIQREMEAHLDEIFSHMNEFEKETVLRSMALLNGAMAKSSVCCKPIF
ncbi:DNA-binding MarR family transcriptional regulator [Planomicrobium koreense]|uniref:DNA-binding MarR family transcriptional regulator n=1 Tax=Planococcus koreensis TaxID=112331 RepID=A0A7W8FRB1_9BACL|nr:MarR family winged helix-turn-helix transcriptional regulator [Planococcus koreensis]MBB5178823.1 DNA-binding MarR family transcriptional regulator [Planococcus koreensis]